MAHNSYPTFALPNHLLVNLTPRDTVNHETTSPIAPQIPSTGGPSATTARACNICQSAEFADVDQQRAHYRSDWHRYNVKTRITGHPPVSEAGFAGLVEGLEDSLSGSESSDTDDSKSSDDAVEALVSRQPRLANRSPSPSSSPTIPQTALAWFHSPPNTQIGIYKQIFTKSATPSTYIDELRLMQKPVVGGRKWALFMTAGGHFAGAIARVSADLDEEEYANPTGKAKKQKKAKSEVEVLQHKTFHRYTTRRKQGGSQSVNDNAKGNAKSAGAQLRRYGEQALRDDIRGLLADWSDEIADCERIWIRASTSNRRIFLDDYTDSVIKKGDERLRTFPFPTRRPTQSELSRCLLELTFVKVTLFTEDDLRAQDEAVIAALPKEHPKPVVAPIQPTKEKIKLPQLTKEEVILRDKWSRLLEMVIRGRLEALKTLWGREETEFDGVDVYVPEWTGYSGTLLQLSAEAGHESVVSWLLEDVGADPTLPVPLGNKIINTEADDSDAPQRSQTGIRHTAYDLARTRGVRNAFRRAAAANPDRWDWLGAGRVPSLLSREMEEAQDEKKKTRTKGLKDKIREREAKEREKESSKPQLPVAPVVTPPPREVDVSGPRKLGGSKGAAEGLVGLTPEMRMKIERERRARAAEARMKTG